MALNRTGGAGAVDGVFVPVAATSFYLAVALTEADITTTMDVATTYIYTASVDTFIKQGATGATTAAAAANSMFVPAGMPALIDGAQGATLSVIGLLVGHATLAKATIIR